MHIIINLSNVYKLLENNFLLDKFFKVTNFWILVNPLIEIFKRKEFSVDLLERQLQSVKILAHV